MEWRRFAATGRTEAGPGGRDRRLAGVPFAHIAVAQVAACGSIFEVLRLHGREAIAEIGAVGEAIKAHIVAGEDGGLDRPGGGPQRLEAILLLHVLRDL